MCIFCNRYMIWSNFEFVCDFQSFLNMVSKNGNTKNLHRLKMEQFLKYMCKSIKNTPSSPNALVPQNL